MVLSPVYTVHYCAWIPIPCADYNLSVSELETNHSTLTQTGLGSLGVAGSRSIDGPCRSRGPNQEESEPIWDNVTCPSRDGGDGPPGPRAAMLARPGARLRRSLPAPLLAHGDADARVFKLRPRLAGTQEGSASAPDADDRHGRHPPAQRKLQPPSPSHGVQGRGARGSVRGVGSVS